MNLDLSILEIDNLTGSHELVGSGLGFNNRMYNLEIHNNDLYLVTNRYNGSFSAGELRKYNTNYEQEWVINLDADNANFYDIQYDPVNNLLYTTGNCKRSKFKSPGRRIHTKLYRF